MSALRKTEEPELLLCVAGEMIAGDGEDDFYYASKDGATVAAVFDGCGGIGARRYRNYRGKTGAYISSRAVSGGVKAWFERTGGEEEALRGYIDRALRICTAHADKSGGLRGNLQKSFPTTAVVTRSAAAGDLLETTFFWAGDSRGYLLPPEGLRQITRDDVSDADALENLTGDGVLTNVVSASAPFRLHRWRTQTRLPTMLLAATDGCFAYLKSPMEFEFLLLDTLQNAQSPAAWREQLRLALREYAGDDFTLCIASYGFGSFENMKKAYRPRRTALDRDCIRALKDGTEGVAALWQRYRPDYYQWLAKEELL